MKNLIRFFVRYPIWANAIIVLILVGGFLSFLGINKSFFPETPSRLIRVTAVLPGTSPQEMEESIVLKIEKALKGIVGIDQYTSVSGENTATINVEGKQGYDEQVLLTDVTNAIDRITSFPVDAEIEVSLQRNIGRVMTIVLEGATGRFNLKKIAEEIEEDLLATGFISQITISGFPEREISFEIPEAKLQEHNLTFTEIAAAIRNNNQNLTGGSIRGDKEEFLIRANAKKYSEAELEQIVVRTNPDGSFLRIKNLGKVKERFVESPNKTLFNGNNAVTIQVNKLNEEDLLEITDFMHEYVERFNEERPGLTLSITDDRSEGLNQRLGLLVDNGKIGLLLVLITLGIFLNLRLSFWVAFGIPFSFLGMLLVISMMGVTINMISLFGMILVIGILVDDGIVVGENIYTHIERGKKPLRAAVDGALEVLPSVFTSVTTTIVVFCTFFFIKGRIGEFISDMAVVVIACLVFSLVECTLVLPAHLSHVRSNKDKPNRIRTVLENGINYIRYKVYGRALTFLIRYRWVSWTVPIALIMMTLGMVEGNVITRTFFPNIEGDETTLNLVLKPGTRETITQTNLESIERKIWAVNEDLMAQKSLNDSVIISTRIDVGTSTGESGGHTGSIEVSFTPNEARAYKASEIEEAIRKKVGRIPDAEKFTIGGRRIFGKPVSISLVSKNLAVLEDATQQLKDELGNFSALKDITDNKLVGKQEVGIDLKPLAYLVGLNHGEITRQIRQGYFGEEVQRLQIGQDEVRMWVRYPEADRAELGQLEKLKIKTPAGQEYPFSDLAKDTIARGIVAINHYNGSREIKVEADMADPDEPVTPLLDEIKNEVLPRVLGQHPGVRVVYSGQERENQKINESAPIVYGMAFFMMVILITLTFRSFFQAVTVIPFIMLGIMGAFWGHGWVGKPVSLLSTYGLLALSGIVINDAVVLVAKFNRLVREGTPVRQAVWEAGVARFRAILLTSITTVVGLYPLILEKSRQAQFLIPMAISVVYGVLVGTIFILLFFPPLLMILNDIRRFFAAGPRLVIGYALQGRTVQYPTPEEVEPATREKIRFKHAVEAVDEPEASPLSSASPPSSASQASSGESGGVEGNHSKTSRMQSGDHIPGEEMDTDSENGVPPKGHPPKKDTKDTDSSNKVR